MNLINRHPLEQKRIAVKVKRINNKKFQVIPGVYVLKEGTLVYKLPPKIKIINEDGDEIMPFGQFVITSETIDPYHFILDIIS